MGMARGLLYRWYRSGGSRLLPVILVGMCLGAHLGAIERVRLADGALWLLSGLAAVAPMPDPKVAADAKMHDEILAACSFQFAGGIHVATDGSVASYFQTNLSAIATSQETKDAARDDTGGAFVVIRWFRRRR